MVALLPIFFGLLGLIVGSFLNVVVLRKGVTSLQGRSKCPSCGKQIRGYDLIPFFSWIILRGRCRNCGSKISVQYPLVEACTGILFALIGGSPFPVGFFYLFLFCTIAAILVCIAVYDMRHTIIPDEWVYSFAALAFFGMGPILATLSPDASTLFYLLGGPLVALPLFLLWFVSGGRWMGLGDAKLALGIGWLLGPVLGSVAVLFSFILGSIVLVPLLVFDRVITHIWPYQRRVRGLTMKSEVPFGPFLIGSCLILWFLLLYGIPIPFLDL